MKKTIPKLYCIVVIVLTILMCVSVGLGQFNISGHTADSEEKEIYPYEVEQVSDSERIFKFSFFDTDMNGECMEFYSNHQFVEAYADDMLIYEAKTEESVFGNTTGSVFNFIEIPDHTREIAIKVTAAYEQVNEETFDFFLGDGVSLYHSIIKASMGETIVSVLNISMGIFLILYWLIMRKKASLENGLLFFGLFATILGTWSFNETDMATILLTDRTAASFMAYVLLMLQAIPFILFVKNFLEAEDKYLGKAICIYSFADIVICMVGHMTGIWEFKESVAVTHSVMVLSLLYLVYTLIIRIRKRGFDRKVKSNFIGAIVLTTSVMTDLIAFYSGYQKTDVIGRFGLLVYIFILAAETAAESLRQIDEGRKADIYRELAVTDILTRMRNRNAFDSWKKEQQDYTDVTLVMFDLNDLKKCNDNRGHAFGDKYLQDAADIIKNTFERLGECYRIGGDEFCVVIGHSKKINVDMRLRTLQKLQDNYNMKSEGINMKIACGYATFDGRIDKSIEDTRSRADLVMYRNKKEIKGL